MGRPCHRDRDNVPVVPSIDVPDGDQCSMTFTSSVMIMLSHSHFTTGISFKAIITVPLTPDVHCLLQPV